MRRHSIAHRSFREEISLSILGFGGMVLVDMDQPDANRIVAESCACGINYFDVAPLYGDGEAEVKVGIALEGHRDSVFLACKTLQRDAKGAQADLDRSLARLKTDHLDLYQFHSVGKLAEVEEIFASGGAAETLLRAREQGKIRFVGFSSHSVPAALAMLDRFHFDSVLFPVNFVCYARGNFGPQVLLRAAELGTARLGLKAMAFGPWKKGEDRPYPKCWYRPIADRELACRALRFALSENVTAVIPPGDERLFRMALELAPELAPMSGTERESVLSSAHGLTPLLRK